MAQKAAHLTQTTDIKPSLFDVVIQQGLNDLLHPSFEKIVSVLVRRYPSLTFLAQWFDECFLTWNFLLQIYHLKKYSATFSERWYGLQRQSVRNPSSNDLENKELMLSLLTSVILPYLKSRLNNAADDLLFNHSSNVNQQSKYSLESIFLNCNKLLHITVQVALAINYLRYLCGKSEFASPLYWLSGVKLKYAQEKDAEPEIITVRNFFPKVIQRVFETGVFFIQFLQWWQNEKQNSLSSLPVPPPPKKKIGRGKFNDVCPLCLKKRKLDTVVSVSGFVFCFSCIYPYVVEHQKCPVTNLKASVDSLIHIYPCS